MKVGARSRACCAALVLATAGVVAVPAHAQTPGDANAALGRDPTLPDQQPLPGGMAPAFGAPAADERDWRFDYHGYFTAPLRIGINKRDDPREGQSETVLHAPPVVPEDLETFSHTGAVPIPYAQLNFSYGNSIVTGTASIVAEMPSVAAGYFDPSTQLGVNDLFVTIKIPNLGENVRLRADVGAFTNRYGIMGEYDEGRYGTPSIARLNGLGETLYGTFGFGDFTLMVEHGLMGQANRGGSAVEAAPWNRFVDHRAGSSFAQHLHAGLNAFGIATLGLHYITAWSQDDRATPSQPDGSINVLAADLRLTMKRFGHLYFSAAHTSAENSLSVGRVVEIMNTRGGAGLEEHYLGEASEGTGKLLTLAAQYDLSIGRLVSYPVPFTGNGPDILVSLFGMQTQVSSDDPRPRYHEVTKRKVGAEGTYSLLPWFAVSARYDRVDPDIDDQRYSFAVVSPRLIFRTGWQSHDQVVLQYSRWLNGSHTTVRTGVPPREDITVIPDEHMISLSASMWW